MLDWTTLIGEDALASVIPEEYARYRRPIHAALGKFLERLPEPHQIDLLEAQARLPEDACVGERMAELARGCPALHKLGQVLARDRRLSPTLRSHLQELESLPPTIPIGALHEILDQELGPLDRIGLVLDPPALAEASVAVVVPFRDTTGRNPFRRGVFKVLKPGIEVRLEQELQLLEAVGEFLDHRCDDFKLPPLDYRESFEQVTEKLRQEILLDQEQRHLATARDIYADDPRILVPAPLEFCTPRVTAMERVTGSKVTQHGLTSPREARRLAGLVVTALIARPIFAPEGPSLFHGDPHAGNLFRTDDGRLAILDWSLVGTLVGADRAAVVQILLGAITLDAGHVADVLIGLDRRGRVDRAALEEVVHGRIQRLRLGEFPGFSWLMGLLDEVVQKTRLGVGADLMLFRKSLHTLEGVIADIGGADSQIHDELMRTFLSHFLGEWPGRWMAPPHSREFATRLSNADLLHLLLSVPLTSARFWMENGFEILKGDG